MITVKDLIEKLQTLPPDAIPVAPNSAAGGYSPLGGGVVVDMRHDLIVLADDAPVADEKLVFIGLEYGDEDEL